MTFTKRDLLFIAIGLLIGVIIPRTAPKIYSIAQNAILSSTLFSYRIILKTNQAGLLTENDPVIENGILIGRVKSVKLTKGRQILVDCRIRNSNKIQSTSIAAISREGVAGETFVNIRSVPILIEDKMNPKSINEDDTIAASYQP